MGAAFFILVDASPADPEEQQQRKRRLLFGSRLVLVRGTWALRSDYQALVTVKLMVRCIALMPPPCTSSAAATGRPELKDRK